MGCRAGARRRRRAAGAPSAVLIPAAERRLEVDLTEQADLFEALGVDDAPAAGEVPAETISYRRRRKSRGDAVNESGLRFDDTVPVTTIEVRDPAVESIPASERVVVGEKVTHRLAQRPASYEVLRYVRPVVKRRDTGGLIPEHVRANAPIAPPPPPKRRGRPPRNKQNVTDAQR